MLLDVFQIHKNQERVFYFDLNAIEASIQSEPSSTGELFAKFLS